MRDTLPLELGIDPFKLKPLLSGADRWIYDFIETL